MLIPVSNLKLSGNERLYVNQCLDESWISSSGKYLNQFEEMFATYCGVEHAIAVSNGTVALHLALLSLGVGPGDEVIVPSMTYVATANAVKYVGATVVLVDCEEDTYCIDAAKVREAITPLTKAIIAVHLFGHVSDMVVLNDIVKDSEIKLIEDAAEAHGAKLGDSMAGSLSDIATFSFFGNKIISCGEGGALTTNNERLAARVRYLMNQGQEAGKRFWHAEVAYNYRMTNLAAAVGLGQLEQIDVFHQNRKSVRSNYESMLSDRTDIRIQSTKNGTTHANWLVACVIDNLDRQKLNAIEAELKLKDIEVRLFFFPMHVLPAFECNSEFPVTEYLSEHGICLPTWVGITLEQQEKVITCLLHAIDNVKNTQSKNS